MGSEPGKQPSPGLPSQGRTCRSQPDGPPPSLLACGADGSHIPQSHALAQKLNLLQLEALIHPSCFIDRETEAGGDQFLDPWALAECQFAPAHLGEGLLGRGVTWPVPPWGEGEKCPWETLTSPHPPHFFLC